MNANVDTHYVIEPPAGKLRFHDSEICRSLELLLSEGHLAIQVIFKEIKALWCWQCRRNAALYCNPTQKFNTLHVACLTAGAPLSDRVGASPGWCTLPEIHASVFLILSFMGIQPVNSVGVLCHQIMLQYPQVDILQGCQGDLDLFHPKPATFLGQEV